jgi:hypothetical protein
VIGPDLVRSRPQGHAVPCPHGLSAADDETQPVSVLRCLDCHEPIGTFYPTTAGHDINLIN